MSYLIGRRLRITALITDLLTTLPVDPDNLIITIKNLRTGTSVVYEWTVDPEVVQDAVGTFHCDVTPTPEGTYWYRWECTGSVEDAVEGTFAVIPSRVI